MSSKKNTTASSSISNNWVMVPSSTKKATSRRIIFDNVRKKKNKLLLDILKDLGKMDNKSRRKVLLDKCLNIQSLLKYINNQNNVPSVNNVNNKGRPIYNESHPMYSTLVGVKNYKQILTELLQLRQKLFMLLTPIGLFIKEAKGNLEIFGNISAVMKLYIFLNKLEYLAFLIPDKEHVPTHFAEKYNSPVTDIIKADVLTVTPDDVIRLFSSK